MCYDILFILLYIRVTWSWHVYDCSVYVLLKTGCYTGAAGYVASEIYFSNFLESNDGKRLKWPSAWFCDATYGSGATPYGARVLHAPYMIKISGLEHLTALKQMKVLGGLLDEAGGRTRRMFWLLKVFEDALPSTRRLQNSATKSSEACQTRGSGTAYRHRMF